MTENSLEKRALSQLNSELYKEAIELYKQLWEQSDNEKWRQQLAFCYLQRAKSFAKRDMVREALVLWDNYVQFAEPPYDAYDHYICWLILSQNSSSISLALKQLSAQQLDSQYPELAVLLGLLMLTEHNEFQRYLSQDSALIAHLKTIQSAMQAYQDNSQDQLNETLKQLPYRSAFKDFRLLLNAAQGFPQSVEPVLAKISAKSPYALIISLMHACTLDGAVLVEQLSRFNYSQRNAIAEIKGFDKKQREFIESLVQHHGGLSDKIKFDLGIQHQSLIGSDMAQQFCQAMLASYPAGQRDFNKCFTAVNAFESSRVKALASERDDNNADAMGHWRQCIDTLRTEDAENDLKIALILRHLAELQSDPEECNQLLIESLEFDSDDLASYQAVLRYFSQFDEDIEDYRQWLKKALERFPQSIDVLSQAIQILIRYKEYKKISQYALKILETDPLNTFAKDIIFSSYLASARQLIQDKKYHLAEQEIKQAEGLKLGKKHMAQTQLVRGFFYLADQDEKRGLKLIAESLGKLHLDPVNAYFQATMEALLTELPVGTVLKELDSIQGHILSEQELTEVIKQFKCYGKESDHQLLLQKAIEKIVPVLNASLSETDYDEELLLTLCQTLGQLNAFELLRHCAALAAEKCNSPIWQFYQLYSENNGKAEKCTSTQINRLEKLREQAFIDKDSRTMVLIDPFLERYYQTRSETKIGFIEDLFEGNKADEEAFADPLEQLFELIPEDNLIKLTNKTEELTMETSPEQLVEDLTKDTDSNEHILLAMMQNPDLFSALMVIKAADSLNIDINFSVNDILESFNVAQKSDSF